jgi:hypothetical protein
MARAMAHPISVQPSRTSRVTIVVRAGRRRAQAIRAGRRYKATVAAATSLAAIDGTREEINEPP